MRTLPTVLFLLATTATPALAEEDEVPGPGDYTHDGFYLRLATGFGSYSESITREDADESTSVTGMASVSELMIGGALRPGLILGGGVWTSSVLASDRIVDGMTPPDEVIAGSGNFTLIGPFVDWYFNPARGLHFQAAIGGATVRGYDLVEARNEPDAVSVGGGVMLGFGYEWWVSHKWSFGVLGRLTAVGAVQEDDTEMTWTHGIATTPSVLFTATLN